MTRRLILSASRLLGRPDGLPLVSRAHDIRQAAENGSERIGGNSNNSRTLLQSLFLIYFSIKRKQPISEPAVHSLRLDIVTNKDVRGGKVKNNLGVCGSGATGVRRWLYRRRQTADGLVGRSWKRGDWGGLTGLKAVCGSAIMRATVVGVSKAITA